MLINQIKGLKYPDENLTRFFFKEKLYLSKGKVLELGCGNGNNLLLFYQYGWEVYGNDFSVTAINDANSNFQQLKAEENIAVSYQFVCDDMIRYSQQTTNTNFDVLLLPSSIYYLHYDQIAELFSVIFKDGFLSPNAKIFIRIRDTADYRFGKGENKGKNCFKLNIDVTGENGCLVTFFTIDTFMKLLLQYTQLKNVIKLRQDFDNYQNNQVIRNIDWVIWGTNNNK